MTRQGGASARARELRARSERRLAAAQGRRDRRRRAADRPPHLRRRQRLLRWSWLPALLVLALAAALALLGPGYREARAAYDAGDHWSAVHLFDRLAGRTPVERWKGDFNAGTARYRAGAYGGAVRHLDAALEHVPADHRCDVQTNRALALQAHEQETTEQAEEQLAFVRDVARAQAAKDAGDAYDAEVLEPRYEGDDPPTVADELRLAGYLFRVAADDAALAAEALADPACAPPPSPAGGGGGAEGEPQDGGQGDEQEGGPGGQQGAPAPATPRAAAEQRFQELLELAGEVEGLAQAAQDGTLEDVPAPGAGRQETPDPAQAEAQRQAELAERNQQAGGGTAPPGEGDGTGTGSGGRPGGGDRPGQGGGGGGRNW